MSPIRSHLTQSKLSMGGGIGGYMRSMGIEEGDKPGDRLTEEMCCLCTFISLPNSPLRVSHTRTLPSEWAEANPIPELTDLTELQYD